MTVGENTGVIAVVAAHNEAERLAATLAGLREAFAGVALWVADDGSRDGTAAVARAAGADVLSTGSRLGKGEAMTRAVSHALACEDGDPVVLLCDGDLGASSRLLAPLVEAVCAGEADLAVASFSRRRGGGFGAALGFARWAVRRRCGSNAKAPLSGQRAVRSDRLGALLPFADGYGMEAAMTIDAVRAGLRVREIELDLEHRATGRTPAGFAHRARQLFDCARACAARR